MLKALFGLVLTVGLVIGLSATVLAESTELQLDIQQLECTVDLLYSNQNPNYSLQPALCSSEVVQEQLSGQVIDSEQLPEFDTSLSDGTPGDQKVFENTSFEPLAGWSGIGNSEASPARPILATGILAITTFGVIDVVFLELRASQAALSFGRVWLALIARAVTRGP